MSRSNSADRIENELNNLYYYLKVKTVSDDLCVFYIINIIIIIFIIIIITQPWIVIMQHTVC